MSAFNNATLMITGGTGSFGSTVLKHFLDSDLKEIRIFSRDEKKQDDMRHELQAKHPEAAKKVKFYIGDVRNPQSIKDAMPGVDYIFHAAALKQVPSCEFFPMQAVQTNIIGTDNVLHAAIDAGVKRVVCLSTDKAAYPINAMGISKDSKHVAQAWNFLYWLMQSDAQKEVFADQGDTASNIQTLKTAYKDADPRIQTINSVIIDGNGQTPKSPAFNEAFNAAGSPWQLLVQNAVWGSGDLKADNKAVTDVLSAQ